jgi:tetratricopeptide (TPR) repeat protein
LPLEQKYAIVAVRARALLPTSDKPNGSMLPPNAPALRHRVRRRVIIAGVLVALAFAALGFLLLASGSTEREVLKVEAALAAGRPEEARAALGAWMSRAPRSGAAHYLAARLAWAGGDLATAGSELARAKALGYSREPLARLRGLLLAQANQASQAEPLLREAFDNGRGPDAEVAEALALIYLGSFRLSEASAVLERWMREAPNDARPYLLQTEVDLRTDARADVVIAHYRAALARDPSLAVARLGLADLLRLERQHSEAAAEYRAYLAARPDDPRGFLGAGQNALELGELDDAVRLLDRAIALAPNDSVALAGRAAVELRRGRLETALAHFDRAVAANPFDSVIRYQRMLILAGLGKKAESESERQAVERIRKDDAEFHRIGTELRRSPQDPKLQSEAARWLMAHGHETEAVEWAKLVLSTHPSEPEMNHLLADYYHRKGQTGLANFHGAHTTPASERGATAR